MFVKSAIRACHSGSPLADRFAHFSRVATSPCFVIDSFDTSPQFPPRFTKEIVKNETPCPRGGVFLAESRIFRGMTAKERIFCRYAQAFSFGSVREDGAASFFRDEKGENRGPKQGRKMGKPGAGGLRQTPKAVVGRRKSPCEPRRMESGREIAFPLKRRTLRFSPRG